MFKPVELSQSKRILLSQLTMHQGFLILVEVLEAQCQQATNDAINCDPLKSAEVLILQARARCLNEFCSFLKKQIEFSNQTCQVNMQQEALQELDAIMEPK
jgi:hypothetical protein